MTAAADVPVLTCRAAVSTLMASLLQGPVRETTVVASTRVGCYLLLDNGAEVLPILTADALALPTAVRLTESSRTLPLWLPAAFRIGATVLVGDSVVRADGSALGVAGFALGVAGSAVRGAGLRIEVVRSVRPARVRTVAGGAPHTALRADRVAALLGRGPGLTPEGDDELAGHLLVVAAAGGTPPHLEAALHRTTALSASLLRAAAQGYAVPAVVAYVDAVVAGDPIAAHRLRPLVAAIGHSSGPALLRGIDTAWPRRPQSPRERTVA